MKELRRFKLLALMLAVITMFSACSGTNETALLEDDESKPYEIEWYFIGNLNQTDYATVENAINDYLKDKINATVKMNALDWGTYDNRISMMLQSGEKFDLCFTTPWCANYDLNAAKGGYVALNDLMDKYAPKTKELLGEDFLKGSQIDGKNYALPANKEKAHSWGFVYREDLADKYNIDMSSITCFEDILPILEQIKELEPDITPLYMGGGRAPISELDFQSVTAMFGQFFDSDDDKIINLAETEEYKESLELARKIYLSGYVAEDCALPTAKDYNSLISSGGIFMSLEQLKPGKDDELNSTVKVPGVKYKQIETVAPRTSPGDTTGSMMAIPRNSENPARVMKFLELLNTDPVLNNLVMYGVEGKHYNKIDDDVIEVIENGGYTQAGCQWMFGNVFICYRTPDEDPEKNEKLMAFNEESKPSSLLGFNFDSEPVKTELAAINNVVDEYSVPLETGSIDPEENLPKYIEKLKLAGADTVLAEIQKQYDEWKKAQ
jgi:putative aldouronate transport system substrate-binding protein